MPSSSIDHHPTSEWLNKYSWTNVIVFTNQFQSELGNRLAELNPDCGEFAKLFGGGGHPKTAGSEINSTQKEDIINILFRYF